MIHINENLEINRSVLEAELSISQATVRLWSLDWAKPVAFEVHPDTHVMVLNLTTPLSGSRLSFRTDQCLGDARHPGRLAFAGAGTSFDASFPPGGLCVLNVEADPDWFETITGFRSQWQPKMLSACANIQYPQLAQCLLKLVGEARAPGLSSKRYAESIVTEAAIYTARYLERVSSEAAVPSQILSNIHMNRISSHFEHMNGYMPDVAELAAICGIGERHLRRLFKQTTGKTISDYARDIWVSKTKRQLADTTLALKEVAALAGFSDPCHFATAFRRATGRTPKAFREHFLASGETPYQPVIGPACGTQVPRQGELLR
jgi:AraC family transcriptional regulator